MRLPATAVTAILENPGHQPLAVACKGCGLERQTFSDIVCHLSGERPPTRFADTDAYRRTMKYFDRIERYGAETVLTAWRRTPKIEWIN